MIAKFWMLCDQRFIAVRIERVASDDNIADLPTRDTKLPIPVRMTAGLPFREAFRFFSKPLSHKDYLFRMSQRA